MEFDEKELNIPVKYDDLISYIQRHYKAYVYLKTDNDFELIILGLWDNWNDSYVKNWIQENRLFRRRNKPFESMMA